MNPSAPIDPNAAAQPQPGVAPVAYQPPAIVGVAAPRNGLSPSAYAAPQPTAAFAPQASPVISPTVVPTEAPAAPVVSAQQPQPTMTITSTPASPAPQPATVAGGTAPGPGPKPKTNPNSTQNSLQIAEVRDGIVIMNDGSFRSVVMVKSINFDLMSTQEQEAVEFSYQGFLNSLFFEIQIFIRSRKVDLRPYIEKLDKIRSEHDNMLLALLMEDYIEYMDDLSQQTNIMDKNFYVVVPYFPVIEKQQILTQNKKFLDGVTKLFDRSEQHVVINEPDLEKAKSELRNRVQAVLGGLQQCGVQGLPLDTKELIELYYDTYNPDTATRQQLKDFDSMTADVVTKGVGTASQAHLQGELN